METYGTPNTPTEVSTNGTTPDGARCAVASGSAVGLFNRRMLRILGTSAETADIIMQEVERGWQAAKERDKFRRALALLLAAEKASKHQFTPKEISDLEAAITAAELALSSSPNKADMPTGNH